MLWSFYQKLAGQLPALHFMSDTDLQKLGANADLLAYASEEPNVALLQNEYQQAWDQGQAQRTNAWNLVAAEDIRYNRWRGRTLDGLRHGTEGKPAWPYEGAPDTRIPLADETIDAVVDILFAAFFGARMNPRPVHA